MNRMLKIGLPLVIVIAAAAAATAMFVNRPQPETQIPEPPVPLVRVVEVRPETLQMTVTSQGTVSPRTQSALVPEVSGRVTYVSSQFVSGGFFEEGDVLLRIDPYDYEQALIRSRAQVAQAELRVAQIRAEARVAREEWDEIGSGEASPLTLFEPQIAEVEAALAGAEAAAVQARRNLERTEIRAPYAGRVREKNVDLGQLVGPAGPVGRIYAIDYAEIRLPLPDRDLAFVDLPLVYRGERESDSGPKVVLRAEFAGAEHEWEGRIVRTEGEIDPKSRMVHAVARVADPYGHTEGRPPLAAGLFVQAEILGITVEGVAVIPRAAVRNGNQVLLVDTEDRLRFREIDILRKTQDSVIVRGGLSAGERVGVSPIAAVTDGMRVRVMAEERGPS